MRVHLAAAILVVGASCTACADAPRHGLVLITLDTTRPDHLGAYGYGRPTSPSLDAFAARGARLGNAWAQSPETGPSLASTLTSRRASVTSVRGNAETLDTGLATLATVASDGGYRTGAFVSTVLLRRDVCAFDRGFETYDDEMTDPCFGHPNAQRVAKKTIDRALAWLDAGRRDVRPTFLWVHLYDPHGPYTPPAATPELDASGTPATAVGTPTPADIPRYQRVGEGVDAREYVDRYDREIAYLDRHLGRLLARLDPARTVVAVHADHGEALGEDGYWFRHGSLLHDPALRIPLVVRGPGVAADPVDAATVLFRNLDLAPTLAGLGGLPMLPDAEGRDLSAWLRGGPPPEPAAAIAEARHREIVRDSTGIDTRWKLRLTLPGGSFVWWPRTDALERRGEPGLTDEDAVAAMRRWLEGATPRAVREPLPGDVDDALRGLGYATDPPGAGASPSSTNGR